MENFLDKLKRYKYECQIRTTVSIRYRSYKGYRAVPSLESYTSSPLEIRLELQLDIGSDHGYSESNHGCLDFTSSSDRHT